MNKEALAVGVVVAAAVLVSGIMISLVLISEQTAAQATGENSSYQYILKNYQNQIVVYEKGNDTPIQILDVPISSLPQLEQAALESGVPIKDDQELRKAIEDFTG